MNFQEFSKKRAQETNSQPSLFELAASPGQGTAPTLSSGEPLLVQNLPLEASVAPKPESTPTPDKIAALQADFELTAHPVTPAVIPAAGSEQDGVHRPRYEQWRRKKASSFLDSLGMLERGRRRKAARRFLLTSHPESDRFSQMIDDEKFDDLAAATEEHLFISIEKEMNLPDFESWKSYQ